MELLTVKKEMLAILNTIRKGKLIDTTKNSKYMHTTKGK
jgi:hypothetical protein